MQSPSKPIYQVDRSACQQRYCTCHDDSAWRTTANETEIQSYPAGCSCGCRWRAKYRYRVRTTCTAWVGEDWTVESDHPISLDDAEAAVLGDIDPGLLGITIACVDQDVSDEHDRSIVDSEVLP